MINGHGNNIYEYEKRILADFSSNIAFNHKSGAILEHLKSKIETIGNYPDPMAVKLTRQLAAFHQINPSLILVTNGSAEAFYLLAHLFQGARTAICTPAFAEYEDACRLYKHKLDYLLVGNFSATDFSSYNTVWLGTPNNPDGTITQAEEIMDKCHAHPSTCFVVDMAYAELTSRQEELRWKKQLPDNLVLIRSLTKSFAIPGLRLGYITASSRIVDSLSRMRPPWSVNSLAMEAGRYILDNYPALVPDIKELTDESLFLQRELLQTGTIDVVPSSCNFFLCRLNEGSSASLKKDLIQQYGILIRDASNFRSLDHSCFRVAAQNHTNNLYLINAIKNIFND